MGIISYTILVKQLLEIIADFIKTNTIDDWSTKFALYKAKIQTRHTLKKNINFSNGIKKLRTSDLIEQLKNFLSGDSSTICNEYLETIIKTFKGKLEESPEAYKKISLLITNSILSQTKKTNQLLYLFAGDALSIENNIEQLSEFAQAQVNLSINSGKYLQNVFSCDDEIWNDIHAFVLPSTFQNFPIENLHIIEKYSYNEYKDYFETINTYIKSCKRDSLESIYSFASEMYVRTRRNSVGNNGNVNSYCPSNIDHKTSILKFISSKILILTSNAGTGKTSLICEIVNRILIKRNLPCILLYGNQIDPNNIADSLMIHYNNKSYNLEILLKILGPWCQEHKQPFIIIIDGLNENRNTKLLDTNLVSFTRLLLRHNFVKVIYSCRTDYFKHNFIEFSSYIKDSSIHVSNLIGHNIYYKEYLFESYIRFYKIKIQYISNQIEEWLEENPLLLRIFCEVHKNNDIPLSITDISQTELFRLFYDTLIKEISDRVGAKFSASVKLLLIQIIEEMISSKKYFNISIEELVRKYNIDQDILYQFIDNNLIIRKDIADNNNKSLLDMESINFTFDAFRDYLISDYVIKGLDIQNFKSFLSEQIQEHSQIFEGCTNFIFMIIKNCNLKNHNDIINQLDWYISVLVNNLPLLSDSQLNSYDIDIIKSNISNPIYTKSIFTSLLVNKRDAEKFPRLNINNLITQLNALDFINQWKMLKLALPRTFGDDYRRYEDNNEILSIHLSLKKAIKNKSLHFSINTIESFIALFTIISEHDSDAMDIVELLKNYKNDVISIK